MLIVKTAGMTGCEPDSETVIREQADLNQMLSQAPNCGMNLAVTQGRRVCGIQSEISHSWTAQSEDDWPDIEGRDKRDTVTDVSFSPGTFFDGVMVHLLTTATLKQLQGIYPEGRFEVPHISSKSCRANWKAREGLCGKWMDRSNGRHWGGGASEDYRPLRMLCHDNASTRGLAEGFGDFMHDGPTQPGPCWRICVRGSGIRYGEPVRLEF